MSDNNIEFSFDFLESKLLASSHCGIEIDYEPDFIELVNSVSVKFEQQYGDTIIPAAPIDWSQALLKACELLDKSKDYRLLSIITRALTHKFGIRGTLKGVEAINALTEHYWLEAFPTIEFDGEEDLFPRANAIAELNSPESLVGDLRATEINLGTVGKISIGRIEKILAGRSENEAFSRDQLLQILNDALHNKNSELLAVKPLLNQLALLELQLNNYFTHEPAPNFSLLKSLLSNSFPLKQNGATESLQANQETPVNSDTEGFVNTSKTTLSNSINSRSEAINLLDKVCEFLQKNDPANPAPLLIKRASNMIGQDFFTILSQLAPDAISQAEQITGPQP